MGVSFQHPHAPPVPQIPQSNGTVLPRGGNGAIVWGPHDVVDALQENDEKETQSEHNSFFISGLFWPADVPPAHTGTHL
jgi:hypothetical protein